MSNPLVAQRQDSTTWHSGINILDDAAGVYDGVQSGSWVDAGISALGAGLDMLTVVMNPVGTLISYGLNWLIEHVKPLQDALNQLAGDGDQISAYSETWKNIGKATQQAAKDLAATVQQDTANWKGAAADAYRANIGKKIDHINAAATCANTISTVVEVVGVITAAVRCLVRDMITQAVGDFIQDALEEVCSLGLGTPVVVAQVVEQVSAWLEKIGALIKKLINSVEKLRPLMSKLEEIFASIKKVLAELHGRPGEGDATHVSSADEPHSGKPGEHSPGDHEPPGGKDGTDPASANAPGDDGANPGKPKGNDSDPLSQDGKKPGAEQEANGRCGGREPIDLATGDMFLVQFDVTLDGVLPLVLERTHISAYRSGRMFGPSWASTLDQRVVTDGEAVYYAAPDGAIVTFPAPPADGRPVSPLFGPRWLLTRRPDGFSLDRTADGTTLYFPAGNGNTAHLARIADRNGNEIVFVRDDTGVVTNVRHSGGYEVLVESSAGLVRSLRLGGTAADPIPLVSFDYDEAGRLREVVNSSRKPYAFAYDHAGRVTKWVDRNGEWYSYEYDHRGRCVATDGSGGAVSGTLEYDDENRLTVETDSQGRVTRHCFNERRQLIRQVDPLGNETRQVWDGYDRLAATVDPLGRTTAYGYDDRGNLVTATRPDGSQTLVTYGEFDLPVVRIDPDGGVWRYAYDERGNPVALTDPAGAVVSYGRNERGHLTSVTDALGNVRRIRADAAGLPVEITDPLGGVTRCVRDPFGRPSEISDPLGQVRRFRWTVEGRLSSRTMPDGSVERWIRDAEGNEVAYVDALGQTTKTWLTHFDLPAAQLEPDGGRYEFRYDTEMRLLSTTNPQGLVWSYEYNEAGKLIREIDYNGREVRYAYDAAGQLTSQTNGAGETVEFRYDLLGNVVERRHAGGVSRFEYNAARQVVRAANEASEVVLQRDPLGRVLAETGNGRTVSSRYDAAGRRIARRTHAGAESWWGYDAAGRPTSLRTAARTMSFSYDPAGHLVEWLLDSGAMLAQSWDSNDRLVAQTVSTVAGRAGAAGSARRTQHRAFQFRADGVVSAIEDQLTGARRFDLDPLGRATRVTGAGWHESYQYDASGNVRHAEHGHPHAASALSGPRGYAGTLLREAGPVSYQYDAQGRVVLAHKKRLSRPPAVWRYSWDPDDQLVELATPDGVRWRYLYDPFGRRIAKLRLAADGSVAGRVDFLWDGHVLAEQVAAGRVTTWDWDSAEFRPLAQRERTIAADRPQDRVDEEFYAIVTDFAGAATELIDPGGNVAWHADRTLWGYRAGASQGGVSVPMRFPGQYHDEESGLYYNYFRYYDPETGRYASPDPLGLHGGDNPHAYVANPTSWLDPFGLSANQRRWIDHSDGWRLGIDRFPIGGGSDFEIHVYRNGEEKGLWGSEGWFNKHGKPASAPDDIPPHLEGRLRNLSIEEMRRDGRLPEKGRADLSGDKWKRPRITGKCKE
ncbi:type IV secretion protein Rhs [Amycolatopsis sp. AA4]|uniref:RHS repeat-associated core domain-containing protein n=1 Tax=Actinomycetes TaxID=1760 RepID=UPI0001B53B37|nr:MULTISPECIES: RHS repeat-associated core domain-containing protein [Actinomycetes]ATY14885.1 type IV secretion protein Rhs [Amycolatopsis sp. AA4]